MRWKIFSENKSEKTLPGSSKPCRTLKTNIRVGIRKGWRYCDSFSQTGFLAAKVFVDAVSTIKPAAINRESVTKALRAVKDFKTDLLCSPWYFGDGTEHNANNVGRIVKLTGEGNTGFAPEKGCTAVEDPDLAPIRAAEAS